MKITLHVYNKGNYYTIYNGDKEISNGNTNGREVKELLNDNGFKKYRIIDTKNLNFKITIYTIEVL